jgi:hypothetical protein
MTSLTDMTIIPTRAQIHSEVHDVVTAFAATEGVSNLAAQLAVDLGRGSMGRLEIDHSPEPAHGHPGAEARTIASVTVNYEELRDAIDMERNFRPGHNLENFAVAHTYMLLIADRIRPIVDTLFGEQALERIIDTIAEAIFEGQTGSMSFGSREVPNVNPAPAIVVTFAIAPIVYDMLTKTRRG